MMNALTQVLNRKDAERDRFYCPFCKARQLRNAAAEIIRHCKVDGHAYLGNEAYFEEAGAMLARRGLGTLAKAPHFCARGGHTFTLRVAA